MTSIGRLLIFALAAISACSPSDKFNFKALNPLKNTSPAAVKSNVDYEASDTEASTKYELTDLISDAPSVVNVDAGFSQAMRAAIETDPRVLAAKNEAEGRRAAIKTTASDKDFNFNATVLGGVEDISDEIAGVAAILKASRVLFDGGKIDAKISSDTFTAMAAEASLTHVRNERGARLAHAWIELEQYKALQGLIDSRLGVLDPLLTQLEKVAASGMGDAGKVAAAQRTVSLIRVTQTDVAEKLAQSKLTFKNYFGAMPKKTTYDYRLMSRALPKGKPEELATVAPGLLAEYYAYLAAEANLTAVEALNKFNIAFEAKAQQPFGNSDYSSDESVGIVLTKKLYSGDQLTSRVENAETAAKALAERVRSTYRDGELAILSSRQMIRSMDKAIKLARNNAEITRKEIKYLRKQLVIGGSTLDSVLSAEARLYDAEAKELSFISERRKAEATILAASGRMTELLGM